MTAINKTFYIDTAEEIDICGSKFITLEGGAYQLPYDVKPAEGEHNYSTCEGCRKKRQKLIKEIKRANKFPLCCDGHKKLHLLEQFKQSDFLGLEGSIADKIIYTAQFIINNLDNDDWFEDFQNYFEYVIESFGCFPNGYGSPYQISNYYSFVVDSIENKKKLLSSSKITNDEINVRLDKILEHIHNAFVPTNQSPSKNNKDFNLLLATYNKWYKTFPFELSYFQPLQKKYSKTLPLINGEIKYNKYTGLTTASLHSKESLTQFLVELTKAIITNINGLKLYEKGLLNDIQKVQLELVLSNRELELSEINSNKEIDSKTYIKTLKNWFKSEKKFITEITPLLKTNKSSTEERQKPQLSIKQIALKLVYEGAVVNRNNSQAIVKEYGHTSGEKLFQEYTYFSSQANRKGNPSPQTLKKFDNKIELFESVIQLLSEPHKQRALDELNILKMNRDNLFG
ncbi:hypothetical protein [Flavobacterium sp. GCM10027622]|uniref:hypothetical protein n=1 Tax=unclassified Flavobacterium TaxID=196869 RepID=UPI00361ACC53